MAIFDNIGTKDRTITPAVMKHPSDKVAGDFYFNDYVGTFQLNKEKAIHRWYSCVQGYSEALVPSTIKEFADASTLKLE